MRGDFFLNKQTQPNQAFSSRSEQPAETVLRFGAFELDLRTQELRRSGRRVRIAPQPSKALAYLVTHSGELVTREELADHLWEEGTHVDAEAGLHAAIKQVRQALGDSANGPRFVETLPRRGYRFVAPVEGPSPEPVGRSWIWLAAGVVLAGLVLGTFAWSRSPSDPPEGPPVLDALFKGEFILEQAEPDSGRRAAAQFEEALLLDPESVPALLGQARSWLRMASENAIDYRVALERSRLNVDKVLEIEPRQPQALTLRARAYWFLDWNWESAWRDFELALEQAPEDVALRQLRAIFLASTGNHAERLEEILRARTLAPTSLAVNYDVAWLYFHARRYEEAVAEGLVLLDLSTGSFGGHHCLAEAYAALGRESEASKHRRAMAEALGVAAEPAATEEGNEATEEPAESGAGVPLRESWVMKEEEGGSSEISYYERAILWLRNDRQSDALEDLGRSLEAADFKVTMMGVDPRLDALRDTPEFAALLERMGLPRT